MGEKLLRIYVDIETAFAYFDAINGTEITPEMETLFRDALKNWCVSSLDGVYDFSKNFPDQLSDHS